MSRPTARLLAAATAVLAALASVSGCMTREPERASAADPAAASAGQRPAAADPALTAAETRAALITPDDVGAPWEPTEGAATWRDALLKATTDQPDCQRLLDVLYADDVLGELSAADAVTALDDPEDQAQLRYQVATRSPADVDRTLAWLRTLPQKCSRFDAATTAAGTQQVQVTGTELPKVGDARQGLRITMTGQDSDSDDQATTLTLDLAAVRVGDASIVLTDGALGSVLPDATGPALTAGTQRLAQVREQGHEQA